jgi:hypothetical protein
MRATSAGGAVVFQSREQCKHCGWPVKGHARRAARPARTAGQRSARWGECWTPCAPSQSHSLFVGGAPSAMSR